MSLSPRKYQKPKGFQSFQGLQKNKYWPVTVSYVIVINGRAYFKNIVVEKLQDFKVYLTIFNTMHERIKTNTQIKS